jgi:hypothetical protein
MNLLSIFNKQPQLPAKFTRPLGLAWTHRRTRELAGPLFTYFEWKYRPKRMAKCSISSVKAHHCALRAFARYLGRPAEVTDLTDKYLSGFMGHRIYSVNRRTAQRDLDCLLALARFAWERDELAARPILTSNDVPQVTPIEEDKP